MIRLAEFLAKWLVKFARPATAHPGENAPWVKLTFGCHIAQRLLK